MQLLHGHVLLLALEGAFLLRLAAVSLVVEDIPLFVLLEVLRGLGVHGTLDDGPGFSDGLLTKVCLLDSLDLARVIEAEFAAGARDLYDGPLQSWRASLDGKLHALGHSLPIIVNLRLVGLSIHLPVHFLLSNTRLTF